MNTHFDLSSDRELEELIDAKLSQGTKAFITVGTGITSSHLGDERNMREFLIADKVVKYVVQKGRNSLLFLYDDSYDALTFPQLRVAVKKDEKLIISFEKYCGTPIKLIPDPYTCHTNYSEHFQNEIVKRFRSVGINPTVIDIYSAYESGLYDDAKVTLFSNLKELKSFLKKTYPNYTMKNIFYPLCTSCMKMDTTVLKRVNTKTLTYYCTKCDLQRTLPFKEVKGKFSWKIDTAIKWNLFKPDFEPFSKAYLDPDVGSYYISKSISEEFLGGWSPEIIHYGQVDMERDLSYKLLPSLPPEIFRYLFLQNRKKDITFSKQKIIKTASDYYLDEGLTYYDYVDKQLQYDILTYNSDVDSMKQAPEYYAYALKFAEMILERQVKPEIPAVSILLDIKKAHLRKIMKLLNWTLSYRLTNPNKNFEEFLADLNMYLKDNAIKKYILFPIIREVLSQDHGVPLSRGLFSLPLSFIAATLSMIEFSLKSARPSTKN